MKLTSLIGFFLDKHDPTLWDRKFLLVLGQEIQIREVSSRLRFSSLLPPSAENVCFNRSIPPIPLHLSNLLYNLALNNLVSGRALLNNRFLCHLVSVNSNFNQIYTKSRNCHMLFHMKNLWDYF